MINKGENKHFGLIFLGVLIPLIIYCFLPMFEIDSSIFALSNIFKLLLLAIGIGIYFYTCYMGISKFIVIPILVLFFYQMFYRFLVYYSPVVINIKTLVLLLIAPIGLFFLKKYSFIKNFAPFVPLIIFYFINLGYAIFNYAYSPNHIYNFNLYLHKKTSILPLLYSIDLMIVLTFIVLGVYFTLNIFKHNHEKANTQFTKTLIVFIFLSSLAGLLAYITGDGNLTNMLGGVKRLNGFFTHSNVFAFFNVCSTLFLASVLPQIHNKKLKYFTLGAILLTIISTLLSFSRANSFGLITLLALNYVIFSKEKFKALINIFNFGMLSLIIFLVIDFSFNSSLSEMIFARIHDEQSNAFRPMVLKYLFTQLNFDGALIYGNGIAACNNTLFRLFSDRFYINAPVVYHPHNSLINIFYDYGLIGFILYYSTIVSLIKVGYNNLFVNKQINPSALALIEMLTFAIAASLVDCYTFNMEMIPFWILTCVLYMNTLNYGKNTSIK